MGDEADFWEGTVATGKQRSAGGELKQLKIYGAAHGESVDLQTPLCGGGRDQVVCPAGVGQTGAALPT